jgi:hypothetical protein
MIRKPTKDAREKDLQVFKEVIKKVKHLIKQPLTPEVRQSIEENLNYLQLLFNYQNFDLEATDNECSIFKKMLENDNEDDFV